MSNQMCRYCGNDDGICGNIACPRNGKPCDQVEGSTGCVGFSMPSFHVPVDGETREFKFACRTFKFFPEENIIALTDGHDHFVPVFKVADEVGAVAQRDNEFDNAFLVEHLRSDTVEIAARQLYRLFACCPEVSITPLSTWAAVRRAARRTMWKEDDGKEPSSKWKRDILVARHSPIESLIFQVDVINIPSWVSVHLVRHKFGVSHYVSSQRDDRHENPVPRGKLPQDNPVCHLMTVNAQELIQMSKKRLCMCAAKETRETWQAVVDAMKKVDSDMAWAMRPECDWCGGRCPEMKGCGKCPPLMELFK